MLRQERRLTGVDAAVEGNRLRVARGREAKESNTARARLIALDVALRLEIVQEAGDGLRGLDPKPPGDLADAWLKSIFGEKVYHVVIDSFLELREWLRHTPYRLPRKCETTAPYSEHI